MMVDTQSADFVNTFRSSLHMITKSFLALRAKFLTHYTSHIHNHADGQAWFLEVSHSHQVSLIRLALRLFSFRYTSVPSKILWKSCFGNCFFFPLIAESQLRKVREGKQPAYKIFPKQTFAQFFFLHKFSVMRYQLLSGYFGLYPHSLSEKSGGE